MTWSTKVVDGLVLAQAQPSPAPPDPGSGPIILIILAAIPVVGTIAVAMGPTLVELVKSRGPKKAVTEPAEKPTQSTSDMVQTASAGLSMFEEMVIDYRAQRDNAQRERDDALDQLGEAQEIIRRQAVHIARLEGGGRRRPPPPYDDDPYDPPHYQTPWEPR